MAGKNLDTERLAEDLQSLREMNAAQREADARLYKSLMDVSSWWRGTSAEAMEERAARAYAEVTEVRNETELDIGQTQVYLNRVVEIDRQYANRMAAFGSGNSIGTGVGSVAQQTSRGMQSLEFKEWLSKATGVSADTNALTEHFSKLGFGLDEIYWIYEGLKKNGVTAEHIGNLDKIGYTFDDVAKDYSRITKITDKELYCYMLKGGEYFKDIENRNPGRWKGLLTNITAGGELNSQTKIALIDVTDGIGAYYRNAYNADGYGEESPTKKNAVSEIGKNERELVIRCFEECHPDQAKSLDTFFSKSFNRDGNTMREAYLTDKYKEDIANIKYISYSAPEPYRSLFLDNADKEEILINSSILEPMNMIAFNGIIVDLDNAANDPLGPYSTFFHELGHGIDDLMYIGGNYSSHYTEDIAKFPGMESYYEGKTEVTLKQALEYDCAGYVKNKINIIGNTLDEESRTIALNLLLSNREDREAHVDYSMLYRSKTDSQRQAIDQVVHEVKADLTTRDTGELWHEQNSLASDVYGGVSYNQLVGEWGHHNKWYWHLYNGGMTSREATADYFSMQMTGDTKAMESVDKFLGNSSRMLGEMFDSMAEKEGISDETQ